MPEAYKESEFKGKPMLEVLLYIDRDNNEKWFSFGVTKAKAILNNVNAIRAFVDKNDTYGSRRG